MPSRWRWMCGVTFNPLASVRCIENVSTFWRVANLRLTVALLLPSDFFKWMV